MSNAVAEFFATLGLKADEKSFSKGDQLIGGLKRTVVGLGTGLIAALGVRELVGMFEQVEESAVHAAHASESLGVTTAAVQELGYAAKLAGIGQEELETGMMHLARGLAEVAKGEGPASDAFNALHISAAAVKNLSLDQTLELLANRFEKMPDGAKKTALAMDLFGRAGAKLIPFLNEGKVGIDGMRQEAEDLGAVIDDKTIDSFEQLHAQGTRLGAMWQGMKNQFAGEMLPVLNKLVGEFLDWAKAHREVIRSAVTEAAKIATAVLEALVVVVKDVVEGLGWLSDHADVAKGLLFGMGIAAAGLALPFIAAMAPIAAVAAAIGVVSAAIVAFMDLRDKLSTKHEETLADAKFGQQAEFRKKHPELYEDARAKELDAESDLPENKPAWDRDASDRGRSLGLGDNPYKMPTPASSWAPPAYAPEAPSRDGGPLASNVTNTVQGNSIKIEVNGASSPAEVAATIQGHLDDWFGTMLHQTHEVT